MKAVKNDIWVEVVGKIIIARTHGVATPELLRKRHQRIIHLHKETGCIALLVDELEAGAKVYDTIMVQRSLNSELDSMGFRTAILVPNSQLAFLARMEFDRDNQRVFYNNMEDAILWLSTKAEAPRTRKI